MRFWILLFTCGLCAAVSGYGFQYNIYPLAVFYLVMSIFTGAIIVKELKVKE